MVTTSKNDDEHLSWRNSVMKNLSYIKPWLYKTLIIENHGYRKPWL